MFEPKFITFQNSPNGLEISGISILVDEEDYTGVKIAAQSLSTDLEKVTRKPSPVRTTSTGNPGYTAIILGSLQKSPMMRSLVKASKINISEIENKWEAFITCVVDDPVEGVEKALVLIGSDKRGTMFAAYTVCEQIGISPWYWWADVPIQKHNTIFALSIVTKQRDPSVKFRGIFINDEAPSLTGWVLEKFGPKYNSEFYRCVYDLLLRLKANFLWPAMWPGYPQPGNSFFEDDPLNQKLADDYGIVVGTSHHEPMQRAMIEWFKTNQGSWSWIENKEPIRKFFREGIERAKDYESYVTLGIRGDGDREMNVENPEEVMKEVISNQREIIKDIHGDETSIRQLWALYKEVQVYYENGLPIPDDVTLLFSDDNFGTIRRLPYGEEMVRHGGAGLYYHLEYVGHPRSYKWLNSNTCGKIHQQLSTAIAQKANQIWVVNVGDIKPMEVPLTYIMSLAWDANCTSAATVPQFLQTMAERDFRSEYAIEVSELLYKQDRLVALRRHEHIEPDTFSVINYNEAENIVEAWQKLTDRAQELYDRLPSELQPGFFQLVLHPIKASFIYTNIRVSQALNHLHGLQRRNSTNKLAEKVLKLFDEDFDLSQEFHAMLGGKWNHMMRQPHFGYGGTWHAPSRDLITGLSYVQLRQDSNPIVGQMGIAVEGSAGVRPGRTNEESDRTHPSRNDLLPGLTLPSMTRYGPSKRSFDIFARGSKEISWSVATQCQFVSLSAISGTLPHGGDDQRIEVRVDWKSVPEAFDENVVIHIHSTDGDYEQVHLPLVGRNAPEDFHGFVETDGHISMHAVHFDAGAINPLGIYYEHLPSIGRNEDGGVHLKDFDPIKTPYLHYSIYCFSAVLEVTATVYFTTVLDTNPSQPAAYEVGFGDDGPHQFYLLEQENGGDLPVGWSKAAQDCVWVKTHRFKSRGSGDYVLVYRANGSGIVLEKIVLDFGGVRQSYLGPPESMRV